MPGLLPISKIKPKEEKRTTSNCQSRSKKKKKKKKKKKMKGDILQIQKKSVQVVCVRR